MPIARAQSFMALALTRAEQAGLGGDVPVGAVLVSGDTVLAQSGNAMRCVADCTAHAEMRAIRQACAQLGQERLTGCELYVTLEPCAMCAGAIAHARIARVIIGALDPRGGAVLHGPKLFDQPTLHHRPDIVTGVLAEPSETLLRAFFRARR